MAKAAVKQSNISDLTPDSSNANKGTQRGRSALEVSLRKLGAGRSILIDRNGRIIAGNKTAETAADIGLDDVLIVQTDGKQLVAVQRTDIDLDTPQGREMAYADNRVGQLDLDFDIEQILSDQQSGADLSWLWRKDEIDMMLADLQPKGTEGDTEPQVDRAEELRQKWGVEPGDLWQLGDHRLICGDCTDAAVVARVMGGERADAMVTDPPYCSGGFQEAGKKAGSVGTRGDEMIANDTLSTRGYIALMKSAIMLSGVGVLYIFTDWRMWINLFDVAESSGYGVRQMIVWDKGTPGMGRGWRSQHELILAAMKVSQPFDPKKAQGNVIQAGRTGNVNHATEKPVDLIEKILDVTDMARAIYDPFSGSGTTLIACENLGRRCRAVEIASGYVAVALERWATHTGKTPVKLG